MSLEKAHGDSNAAKKGGSTDAMTGSVGMTGFTKMPYPADMPARLNSDVANTEESIGSLGNDGTNMDAYEEQKVDIKSKTGE